MKLVPISMDKICRLEQFTFIFHDNCSTKSAIFGQFGKEVAQSYSFMKQLVCFINVDMNYILNQFLAIFETLILNLSTEISKLPPKPQSVTMWMGQTETFSKVD